MRNQHHTLPFIPSSAIMLALPRPQCFLSAGTALGQARCPYPYHPGRPNS